MLTFHRPLLGLFQSRSKEKEGTQLIAYSVSTLGQQYMLLQQPEIPNMDFLHSLQHLSEHCAVMTLQYMAGVHRDWVRRVHYLWHNHSVASCSGTPTHSLVIRDIERKRRSYVFRVRKVS